MYTSKVHLLHIRRNERTPASVTSLCQAKKAPVLRQAPLFLVRVTGPEACAPGRRLRPLTRLHGRFKSCPKRCAHKAKKAPVLRQAPLLLVRVTGPEACAPGRRLRPLTRLHGRFKSCPKRCAHKAKKAPVLRQAPLLLVRVTGLEPARQGHQNLNLARLPFRHTRMNGYASSIPVQSRFVNRPRGRAQPDVVGLQYMLDK